MTAHSDALTRLAGLYAGYSEIYSDDHSILTLNEQITVGDLGHAVAAMTFVRKVAHGEGDVVADEWATEAKRLIDDK